MLEIQGLLQSGLAAEAEARCREILAANPDLPDGLNFLAVALGRQGRPYEAERALRRALELRPGDPGYLLNLGNRLREQGKLEQALDAWRLAHQRSSRNPAVIKMLVQTLGGAGRLEEAATFARAITFCPEPRDPDAVAECGRLLAVSGARAEAIPLLTEACTGRPERADYWLDLARLHYNLDRFRDAREPLERVVELEPANGEARTMLAASLLRDLDYERMEKVLSGLRVSGGDAANAVNLTGLMQVAQGRLEEGLASMALLEEIAPDAEVLQMTRVMYLNYDPRRSPEDLFEEHRRFGARFARHLVTLPPPDLRRDPERRLRIGFLSPDFRTHSVAYFVAPIFQALDRERFEIYGYAHVNQPDCVTQHLRGLTAAWRDITKLDNQAVAERIRADGIDIAIDLAGLTANSRILALTARPAPVQMTYLGYPNTTGLPQIDYRITDPVADPDDADDLYTETLIRLPRCFLCYAIPNHAPPTAAPPLLRNGYVTFGSFNQTNKLNRHTIGLWSEVLKAVPGSKLLIKSQASADGKTQTQFRAHFADAGLDPARIAFAPFARHQSDHLEWYNEVDIALDTIPYNGTTTTCEALWMGVPVVTLTGDRHASRVGASLLSTIGFGAGITGSPAEFVTTVKLLAESPEMLAATRRHLRRDLLRSPLCDMAGHARALEEAFREVWRHYCAPRPARYEMETEI